MSTVDSHVEAIGASVAAIFEELSGERPQVDAATSFLEMGYDSLFLTQVAQKIQSQMKVKITFRQLLGDYSTIASLAAFLAGKIPRSPRGRENAAVQRAPHAGDDAPPRRPPAPAGRLPTRRTAAASPPAAEARRNRREFSASNCTR